MKETTTGRMLTGIHNALYREIAHIDGITIDRKFCVSRQAKNSVDAVVIEFLNPDMERQDRTLFYVHGYGKNLLYVYAKLPKRTGIYVEKEDDYLEDIVEHAKAVLHFHTNCFAEAA